MPKHSEDLLQAKTKWLLIEDFEYLCDLTRKFMAYGEPIPDYSLRNNALLESALGLPQQTFDKKLLYPSFTEQGAVLFYSLVKNHPFENGNKRIAVMSLLAFLCINDKWINFGQDILYDLACEVSQSKPAARKKILVRLEKEIRENLVDFPVSVGG